MNNNKIEGVFCIIDEAVKAYVNNPSPILHIDGCHGRNGNKLLCASFRDMNHKIQSIALYACGEENINHYLLFFTKLLQSGIQNKSQVVLMTDAGSYFEEAINLTFKRMIKEKFEWVLCYQHYLRHLADFINKEYGEEGKDTYLECEKHFYYAIRSPTEEMAMSYIANIREKYPAVADYIQKRGYFYFRFNYKSPHFNEYSNNVSESLNSMFLRKRNNEKSIRESSLYKIFDRFIAFTYERLEHRFLILGTYNKVPGITCLGTPVFCKWVVRRVLQIGYAYVILRNAYKVNEENSTVYDPFWKREFKINLTTGSCDCGLPEQELIPCIHMIALLYEQGNYHLIPDYIDNCYYRDSIKDTTCNLLDYWRDTIRNTSGDSRNIDFSQYEHIEFSFWYFVTSITKRIPSVGEREIYNYHGIQGKKIKEQIRMNKA